MADYLEDPTVTEGHASLVLLSKKVFKLGENLKPGLYFVQAIQSGITKTIKGIKF